jgi:hypothetical protein
MSLELSSDKDSLGHVSDPGSPVPGSEDCVVQSWGDIAEEESPTRSAPPRAIPELEEVCVVLPKSGREVCVVLPKLEKDEAEPSLHPEPAPSECLPSEDACKLMRLSYQVSLLEARVVDLDDALVRYGILFDQAVQRLDGQIQQMGNQQRQSAKSLEDTRKTMLGVVAEIGPERVKAAVQQQQEEARVRQQQAFSGQRQSRKPPPEESPQPQRGRRRGGRGGF